MSPYQIDILLRVYCRPVPPNELESAPILEQTLRELEQANLVEYDEYDGEMCWRAGPALHCYVDALCAIPAPEQVWLIPKDQP